MQFKEGDLIQLKKTYPKGEVFPAIGMVLRAYESEPLIFLNNKKMNEMWLEDEDTKGNIVYDIIYEGVVEEAVLAEWLTPWVMDI